jgi:O-methyltransferase involved in polyketide biosynthesis
MASDRISPTAHYTGYVWAHNGLSHKALETLEGRLMFNTLALPDRVSGLLGGPSLNSYLLTRHAALDLRLTAAIDSGVVSQVVEVAAGMSPRGWRFASRYGSAITYIEADLPAMAARKRGRLQQIGSLSEYHQVLDVDALSDQGDASLAAILGGLDLQRGVAVITEGLINYLSPELLVGLWARIARGLRRFPNGLYLSEIHLKSDDNLLVKLGMPVLSAFVGGWVHLHFDGPGETLAALAAAGFDSSQLHQGVSLTGESPRSGRGLVRIIEASTIPPASTQP